MGTRGAGRSQAQQPADHAVDRLCRLSLVPCDGTRVVRGRSDGAGDERAVRQHQSRPRRTAGHRPDIHERAASPWRAGRLAFDHVSDAGCRTGVGWHLFSKRSEIRPASLYRYFARSVAHVPRRAGQDRAEPRGLAGAADRPRAAGRQGHVRAERTRRRGQATGQRFRHGAWRLARRAKVSAACDPRNVVAGGVAHRRCAILRDCRAYSGANVRRRHLRSFGRRLLALFGRRQMAGAAFREDAVRQRAIARAAGAGLSTKQQPAFRHPRTRNGRLAPARNDHAARRILRFARRRLGRRRGQVLCLVEKRNHRADRPGSRRLFHAPLRCQRRRQFRRPQHPQPLDRTAAQRRRRSAAEGAARHSARRARRPRSAGPRRQDTGRLERADDRGAGQCRDHS